MDISPFYELRGRLYACAAAGCGTISEDFRLKRAAEAFEPLSKANKVFGRLYESCMKLFSENSPAELLSDCIALADALAVTQGSFADNSEVKKEENDIPSKAAEAPYSEVNELCGKISKHSPKLAELAENELALVPDARVLSAFIGALGKNSIYLDAFAENIFGYYGKTIVPLLKNAVGMNDPKTAGTAIIYISRLSGKEENGYFLSLMENAEAPQNVRIAAIEALSDHAENAPALCSLYSSEKGKIKTAALTAVLKLDPPEADEIVKKLIERSKGKTASIEDVITEAKCPAAEEYVRFVFADTIEKLRSKDTSKSLMTPIENVIEMMRNKTGIADCFKEIKEISSHFDAGGSYHSAISARVWDVLIKCFISCGREEAEKLITELYRYDRGYFFPPYFFMRFVSAPEKTLSADFTKIPEWKFHSADAAMFLCNIKYSPAIKMYVTNGEYKHFPKSRSAECKPLPLFQSIPDSFIKLISEAFLNAAKDPAVPSDSIFLCMRKLIKNSSENDREKLKEKLLDTAFAIAEAAPSYSGLELIAETCPPAMAQRCRGLLSGYVLHQLISCKRAVYISIAERLPLSDYEKTEELNGLLNMVAAAKGDFAETTRNTLMNIIRDEIDRIVKGR